MVSRGIIKGRLYDYFLCWLFLYAHREPSALARELREESDQFRFLRADCFAHLKGSGLILAKASAMSISIPLDLSTPPFVPLPPTALLAPSLVLFTEYEKSRIQLYLQKAVCFCVCVSWCAFTAKPCQVRDAIGDMSITW